MSRTNDGDNNGGCAFPISNNQICECGETQTLEIIKEFNKLYVEKLRKIQSAGDHGSNLQAKINLQQDWIRDLTEQNEMLVRVVEELEVEATDRVVMLEEKLRNSAQQGNEVMQKYRDFNFAINLDATFQNLVYLQSDVRNLLEFIKRARDEGIWSIAGLQFYNIGCEDLFGSAPCDQGTGDQKSQKQLKVMFEIREKIGGSGGGGDDESHNNNSNDCNDDDNNDSDGADDNDNAADIPYCISADNITVDYSTKCCNCPACYPQHFGD